MQNIFPSYYQSRTGGRKNSFKLLIYNMNKLFFLFFREKNFFFKKENKKIHKLDDDYTFGMSIS